MLFMEFSSDAGDILGYIYVTYGFRADEKEMAVVKENNSQKIMVCRKNQYYSRSLNSNKRYFISDHGLKEFQIE